MGDTLDIKGRLSEFIKAKGHSMASFERKVGFVNAYLRNSKGAYSTPQLRKILAVYPDLNLNWLITGQGSMLETEESPDIIAARGAAEAMAKAGGSVAGRNSNIQYNQNVHNAVQDGDLIDVECGSLTHLIKDIATADKIDLEKVPESLRWLIREFQERGKQIAALKKGGESRSEVRQLKKQNEQLQKENSTLHDKLDETREKLDEAKDKLIDLYSQIHSK